ncbi:MAG: UbiA prenyltransferase [Caloramator sp.]|jgi:4-hydroxybenzoate polyprenyltransferase|uniref:decaprenyl-phosphate phosphoribosyltransferase n=1 Tax=Caloramator sp. TaxID=1871330 RepID=UPI001DC21E8C|nr:decaprenyl-phosphate phosphoribosyltransferase [Caloramator sp.]MBZ4663764.1 UbiA prenyltransferase [Caloramator sp.]
MNKYIELMRPKQWIKNFFVFGAIIFSKKFLEVESILKVILTFFSFCLISSSVYIMNDIKDLEQDKIHPKKKNRPIASGRVSIKSAIIEMIVLIIVSLSTAFYLNKYLLIILLIYFINNIIYTFKVKHLVLLDVISIAIGFILRVIAGGVVINVELSVWILLCTLFISLFLGFEKRKNELKCLEGDATKHRKILDDYSIKFLDDISNIVCGCTIIFYSLYTFFAYKHKYMMITDIFVIYGLFRYKYLTEIKDLGGSPTEAVLTDIGIIVDVILWGIFSAAILLFT